MRPSIKLISILTDNLTEMLTFYKDVLGFTTEDESGGYIELIHDGVRIALCSKELMYELTKHEAFLEERKGKSFELAFWVATKTEVDSTYKELIDKGATAILAPHDMPWGQRTAMFADPDGNCHEVYAD
ncbi:MULTISPECIES: VOC family protein [unclassified Fusibacter]|uniref:VOC family protein n=1 Tax=unclassified Fusibacter TaxID=2624464 RepID=UPI001011676E|nr:MULTISPECIES: VOC family protein [unclassified Fusibacter]MCK8061099.1 VOC family protein [Fusibacter sp. A2]NPE23365.1 glyoxalase [Fusibacter sp. A1]RXV59410.1 glyoxalase [Fusibacter sp. A1]